MDYSWMNDALAWIGPVAAQVNEFTIYKSKVLALVNGIAVAEYEAPEPLPLDEPIGLSYQAAKTINWSRVKSFTVGKTLELGLYGGKVKLPIIEQVYDPALPVISGEAYSAADLARACAAVLPVVEKKAYGAWAGNIHVQGDLVCGMPTAASTMRYAWLAFDLENNAEIPFDAAKMLTSLPLDAESSVYFGGERDIISTRVVDVDGVKSQITEVVGASYADMTIVSGSGKMWFLLAQSSPIDLRGFIGKLGSPKFFVSISPEIAGLFKTINSLASADKKPDVTMSFGEDGVTVHSDYVEAVKLPATFQDNAIPDFSVQVQTRLIEVSSREWLQIGLSSSLAPILMQDGDCTIFVQPMGKRK